MISWCVGDEKCIRPIICAKVGGDHGQNGKLGVIRPNDCGQGKESIRVGAQTGKDSEIVGVGVAPKRIFREVLDSIPIAIRGRLVVRPKKCSIGSRDGFKEIGHIRSRQIITVTSLSRYNPGQVICANHSESTSIYQDRI